MFVYVRSYLRIIALWYIIAQYQIEYIISKSLFAYIFLRERVLASSVWRWS